MTNYHYILFENHEQAVKLKQELREAGCRATIAPTPREVTLCCGVSLMIKPEDYPAVEQYLAEHPEAVYKAVHEVSLQFDPKRDHYC